MPAGGSDSSRDCGGGCGGGGADGGGRRWRGEQGTPHHRADFAWNIPSRAAGEDCCDGERAHPVLGRGCQW